MCDIPILCKGEYRQHIKNSGDNTFLSGGPVERAKYM